VRAWCSIRTTAHACCRQVAAGAPAWPGQCVSLGDLEASGDEAGIPRTGLAGSSGYQTALPAVDLLSDVCIILRSTADAVALWCWLLLGSISPESFSSRTGSDGASSAPRVSRFESIFHILSLKLLWTCWRVGCVFDASMWQDNITWLKTCPHAHMLARLFEDVPTSWQDLPLLPDHGPSETIWINAGTTHSHTRGPLEFLDCSRHSHRLIGTISARRWMSKNPRVPRHSRRGRGAWYCVDANAERTARLLKFRSSNRPKR